MDANTRSRGSILYFLIISLLFLFYQSGRCDSQSIQVELTAQKSEISFGEDEVPVVIKITNNGPSDIHFSDLGYFSGPSVKSAGYRIHLTTDDPAFELALNQIIGTSGPLPAITLKPGESTNKSMAMRIRSGRLGESVAFKVGFKLLENSTPIWSNPVTIKLRDIDSAIPRVQQDLHLKLEASVKSHEIFRNGIVHVRITNTTSEMQKIEGIGDVFHGDWRSGYRSNGYTFAPIRSDSRSITVDTGATSCNSHFRQFDGLMLKPGEFWEADCAIFYEGGAIPNPHPITFRMGILSPAQKPVWSNELTLRVVNPS